MGRCIRSTFTARLRMSAPYDAMMRLAGMGRLDQPWDVGCVERPLQGERNSYAAKLYLGGWSGNAERWVHISAYKCHDVPRSPRAVNIKLLALSSMGLLAVLDTMAT